MLRQVVGTTFQLMETYQDTWLKIRGSQDVPTLGYFEEQKAEAFEIDQANLVEYFRVGLNNFAGVWKNIIEERDFKIIHDLARGNKHKPFSMPVDTWVRIVYRYAGAFRTTPRQRFKVLDTLTPLYYGRVASLVNELREMTQQEAERHFEEQALAFEGMKDYLIGSWKGKGE
jgi:hypothetical protein